MAIAVVKDIDGRLLLRKTDPERNPYEEPWALFGGRIEGDGKVQDLLNKELTERWNFSVTIVEKPWWDEDIKVDHDNEEKRFVYIDAICSIANGEPKPINVNESLEWVAIDQLASYELNPPTYTLLERLGYLN